MEFGDRQMQKIAQGLISYGRIMKAKLNSNTCNHWSCNKADNTCVGCGTIICSICLKEPANCKCENKDICCTP